MFDLAGLGTSISSALLLAIMVGTLLSLLGADVHIQNDLTSFELVLEAAKLYGLYLFFVWIVRTFFVYVPKIFWPWYKAKIKEFKKNKNYNLWHFLNIVSMFAVFLLLNDLPYQNILTIIGLLFGLSRYSSGLYDN